MILVFTTHPIQYQTPLWRALFTAGVSIEVCFLSKQGLEKTFDEQFGEAFSWDIDLLSGYPSRFIKTNNASSVNSFWKLRKKESLKSIINGRKITAIWIQGWQVLAYWQIVFEAKLLGIPVWIRAESNDLKSEPFWKGLLKALPMHLFFSGISKFLYIGSGNKRLFQRYSINESQMYYSPYCVDNDRFFNDSRSLERSSVRKLWRIPEDSFCFLFCGKFIDKKRPTDLVKAASFLVERYPNIHLLFVGKGELEDAIRRQLNKYKLKATFTGFLNQNEIVKAYKAADCLVLPSDYGETWGLVANEALAVGIPVIASDRCGCSEDLVKAVNPNLVVKFGDLGDLRNRMEQLMLGKLKLNLFAIDDYSYQKTVEVVKTLI